LKRPPAALAAVLAIGVVAATATWLASHSLQQDFAAYWTAGNARRLGLDPYVNYVGSAEAPALWDGVAIFRHSRFLYPPLVAELFRPLAALPYRAAKLAFTGAMIAAWIGAGLLGARDRRWRVFILASALFFPLYRHLERGQIDLWILFFLALAWRTSARPWLAGAALALAAAFKPSLLGLLPVLWAAGRARLACAALAAAVVVAGVTAAVTGPARLREYALSVLPRVALYGEGGTESMLLPADRFPPGAGDDSTVRLDGRDYRASIWSAPSAASFPRLLAPDAPSRATNLAPYALAIAGLGWAARRLRGRSAEAGADPLLLSASAVACVVTSPAGWVMGLVLAIPIAPRAAALVAGGQVSGRLALAVGAAWVAAALPAPFSGFPALAGGALAAAAVALAMSDRSRPSVPP
jgi:hypothetical protein